MTGNSKNQLAVKFLWDWYTNASPAEKIAMLPRMMQSAMELEQRNLLECVYDAHVFNGHVEEVAKELTIDYLSKNYQV